MGSAKAVVTVVTLMSLSGPWTRPGQAEAFLEPGFFMEYRVETEADGRRSEERFRVEVSEDLGAGRRLLALAVGGQPSYRATYRSDDSLQAGTFAPERFERIEGLEDGRWLPLALGDVELLATLRDMEERLAAGTAKADSSVSLGGRGWEAEGYALADSAETVQESASVTLRVSRRTLGDAWIIPALPLGGWLRYDAATEARKVSEIGGRRFVGEPERSRERWTLVALGLPGGNK